MPPCPWLSWPLHVYREKLTHLLKEPAVFFSMLPIAYAAFKKGSFSCKSVHVLKQFYVQNSARFQCACGCRFAPVQKALIMALGTQEWCPLHVWQKKPEPLS